MLTGYPAPADQRRTGRNYLATWLKNREVVTTRWFATTALEAAEGSGHRRPRKILAMAVVARLTREVMTFDQEITETEALIEGRFRDHPHASIILSMSSIVPVLGAEFIARTSGDVNVFGSPDRLADVTAWGRPPKTLNTSATTCAGHGAAAAA